jgi:hypothetical protein
MTTARKLCLSLALLIFSFPLLQISGWFGLGIPIGLLLSILYWLDLGRELRANPPANRTLRILGFLMGVPQALFGLLCLVAGVSIIGWVLYNSFWHRDPHYTGGFLTFGIGPLLSLFGIGWLVDAFRRPPSSGA